MAGLRCKAYEGVLKQLLYKQYEVGCIQKVSIGGVYRKANAGCIMLVGLKFICQVPFKLCVWFMGSRRGSKFRRPVFRIDKFCNRLFPRNLSRHPPICFMKICCKLWQNGYKKYTVLHLRACMRMCSLYMYICLYVQTMTIFCDLELYVSNLIHNITTCCISCEVYTLIFIWR